MLTSFALTVLIFFLSILSGHVVTNRIDSTYQLPASIAAGFIMNILANLLIGPFTILQFVMVVIIFMIGFYLGQKINFKKK